MARLESSMGVSMTRGAVRDGMFSARIVCAAARVRAMNTVRARSVGGMWHQPTVTLTLENIDDGTAAGGMIAGILHIQSRQRHRSGEDDGFHSNSLRTPLRSCCRRPRRRDSKPCVESVRLHVRCTACSTVTRD